MKIKNKLVKNYQIKKNIKKINKINNKNNYKIKSNLKNNK